MSSRADLAAHDPLPPRWLPDVEPLQGLADIIDGEVVREGLLVGSHVVFLEVAPCSAAAPTLAVVSNSTATATTCTSRGNLAAARRRVYVSGVNEQPAEIETPETTNKIGSGYESVHTSTETKDRSTW